jgi:hypothetical protein
MPSTAALHSCAGPSGEKLGAGDTAFAGSGAGAAAILPITASTTPAGALRKLRRIVMQRHRADLRHAFHVLHRAVLAQQDFEDVAALGLLHQRRRDEPHAARQAMDDAEVFHGCRGSPGFTARGRFSRDRLAIAHQQEHQVEHRQPGIGMLDRILQPALADEFPMHLDQVEGHQVVEEIDDGLFGQGIRQHRLQPGLQAAGSSLGLAQAFKAAAQLPESAPGLAGGILQCRRHALGQWRCRTCRHDDGFAARLPFRQRAQARLERPRHVGRGADMGVVAHHQTALRGVERHAINARHVPQGGVERNRSRRMANLARQFKAQITRLAMADDDASRQIVGIHDEPLRPGRRDPARPRRPERQPPGLRSPSLRPPGRRGSRAAA